MMMICNLFDIVEVPFPFSDILKSKRRKALVVSGREFNEDSGNSVLMMITSATNSSWASDVPIQNLKKAGLRKNCVCRLKFFTLDNKLILAKNGELDNADVSAVKKVFKRCLL